MMPASPVQPVKHLPDTTPPGLNPGEPPERLKARADFLACRGGRRVHESAFTLQLLNRRDGSPAFRAGFTATKKLGNAVIRNRAKRRLREAVRMAKFAGAVAGCDIVLIARETALDQEFTALIQCVERATSKALKPRVAK